MTCLEGREVDDAVDSRILLEDLVESVLICQVHLVELGPFAADELDTVEGDF